ncbi:hypothetical protein JCM5353_006422 [Sporobolomyces roseus]
MSSSDDTDNSDSSSASESEQDMKPTPQVLKTIDESPAPSITTRLPTPLAPCVPKSSAKSRSKKRITSNASSKPKPRVYVDCGEPPSEPRQNLDVTSGLDGKELVRRLATVESQLSQLLAGQATSESNVGRISSNLDAFISSSRSSTLVDHSSPVFSSTQPATSLQQLLEDKHDLATRLQDIEEGYDQRQEWLDGANTEIGDLSSRIEELEGEVKERDEKIRSLVGEIAMLKAGKEVKEKKSGLNKVKASASARSSSTGITSKSKSKATSKSSSSSVSVAWEEEKGK